MGETKTDILNDFILNLIRANAREALSMNIANLINFSFLENPTNTKISQFYANLVSPNKISG